MRLQLPERFKLTVPARKVVLLPDTHFFCRAVDITAPGAVTEITSADVATQVELALEALAPFPVAQMYHGHFWRPGAKTAFVFAAYRKRFPSEQVETWTNAEAVLPTFASVLNAKVADSTTLLLWSEKTLTAIRWEDANDGPQSVVSRDLPPPSENAFADHAALRETMLRESGATINVIESATPPVLDATKTTEEFTFSCEHTESVFTREQLEVLDVRDKDELLQRRRARARDLILWRVLLGCAATIVLCIGLEFLLVCASLWRENRLTTLKHQEPRVTKIIEDHSLAMQIDELTTKRMRPFEMIALICGADCEKLPKSIMFSSASMTKLTLTIEGHASISEDFNTFRSSLSSNASVEKVEVPEQRLMNGQTTFKIVVTFKPNAFQTADQS